MSVHIVVLIRALATEHGRNIYPVHVFKYFLLRSKYKGDSRESRSADKVSLNEILDNQQFLPNISN